MANHMAEVAKMLGLELGEEFKVTLDEKITRGNYKYKFEDAGLQGFNEDNASAGWYHAVSTFDRIVRDDSVIIKLPFKPKDDEKYWFIQFNEYVDSYKGIRAINTPWINSCADYSCFKLGNCFRTKEEAEANKKRIYRELTGKEWTDNA